MNITNRAVILCLIIFGDAVRTLAGRDSDPTAAWSSGRRNGLHYQNASWTNAEVPSNHTNDPLHQTSEGAVADPRDWDDSLLSEPSELGLDPHESNSETTGASSEYEECPICYLRREEAKRIRLEYIKRTILDRLGMDRPPNISANIVLPKNAELNSFMTDYFSGTPQNDQPQSSFEGTILQKMILFPKKPLLHWDIGDNTNYAFTFSDNLYNYDVQDATLHIHILGRRVPEPSSAYYVLVKRVRDPPIGSLSPNIKMIIRKKVYLRPPEGQWVALNLTDLVQEWFDYPEEHNVVQVSLVDVDNNPHDELLDTNIDSSYSKRSFLVTNVAYRRQSRMRRAADDTCTERSPVTSCCKYPLVVDFEALNWPWVIAPRSFVTNICKGVCRRMQSVSGGYAHIISALPTHDVLCCAPRRMSELQMFYMEANGNIQFTTLQDMKVESCHCT